MSRITAPVSKLTRTVGSNASISRPSNLLSNGSKSAASVSRKPDLGDHHHPESHDNTTRHLSTLLPSHRPQPTPSATRTIPLMQTFTTTSSRTARSDTSTIDYCLMPVLSTSSAPQPPLRVPLLPDSFAISHAVPDTPDAPLAMPEISVVAAHPENVSAVSPLTEVEGMGADGVELGFVHDMERKKVEAQEGGMIKDLWKGLMEDVFGEEKRKAAV